MQHSHHLQEPLRKIQTFATCLRTKQNGSLNDETRMLIEKINTTAEHMHGLTADMAKYSNLITSREAQVRGWTSTMHCIKWLSRWMQE